MAGLRSVATMASLLSRRHDADAADALVAHSLRCMHCGAKFESRRALLDHEARHIEGDEESCGRVCCRLLWPFSLLSASDKLHGDDDDDDAEVKRMRAALSAAAKRERVEGGMAMRGAHCERCGSSGELFEQRGLLICIPCIAATSTITSGLRHRERY